MKGTSAPRGGSNADSTIPSCPLPMEELISMLMAMQLRINADASSTRLSIPSFGIELAACRGRPLPAASGSVGDCRSPVHHAPAASGRGRVTNPARLA